jgi:hypothetical protein
MKRHLIVGILLIVIAAGCGSSDRTVEVAKPRYHKTWPKKHKWHKKLRVWKFTLQMPERGGVKKVKMKG